MSSRKCPKNGNSSCNYNCYGDRQCRRRLKKCDDGFRQWCNIILESAKNPEV